MYIHVQFKTIIITVQHKFKCNAYQICSLEKTKLNHRFRQLAVSNEGTPLKMFATMWLAIYNIMLLKTIVQVSLGGSKMLEH